MKKKKIEEKEEDFLEYATERLSNLKTTSNDKEITKDLLFHAMHITINFDNFKQVVSFMANTEDLLLEFEEKFGNRYTCKKCVNKEEKCSCDYK